MVVGTAAGGSLVSGCAVSESDVHRWEQTERGPYKLVAVITHDKYSWDLRIASGLSLIRMPPRSGRRQGINYLVERFKDEDGVEREGALAQLGEEARTKIVNGMAPEMIKMIQVPPPAKKADGTTDPDQSIPYKDAAFAMLSHEPSLVSDPKTKADLVAALNAWVQTDFENRIDNSSQQYGVEQVMRFLGSGSVKALPALLTDDSTKIDKISQLVADLGDPDARQKASDTLVALAKKESSADWVKAKKAYIQDQDNKAQQKVTPQQLDAQTTAYQDAHLESVFGAMKRVGGRPIIEYCVTYAADKNNPDKRRALALAALEGRVDKNNTTDVDRLFSIARSDDTPDEVRDVAFQRLGELPKELIVPKLYTMFDTKKWKVRWVAASLVLKTMTTKDVPTFLAHLPTNAGTKMGMSEPVSYGSLIQKMDAPAGAPKAKDLAAQYVNDHSLGSKLTALGVFYNGGKGDQPKVAPLANDTTAIPKCDPTDECGWSCDVPKAGSSDTESKTIATVGDFVKFCVLPSMNGK
jgi:hypothetical protein